MHHSRTRKLSFYVSGIPETNLQADVSVIMKLLSLNEEQVPLTNNVHVWSNTLLFLIIGIYLSEVFDSYQESSWGDNHFLVAQVLDFE